MNPNSLQQQHSGFYRPIDTLSTSWAASPEIDKPRALTTAYFQHTISQSTLPSPSSRAAEQAVFPMAPDPISSMQPRHKQHKVAGFLRRLADKLSGDTTVQHVINVQPVASEPAQETDEVPLRDWKAWGYYASPSAQPPSRNTEEVFQSLMDDSGNFFPERWIRGLQHPALPPRPQRWKDPPRGAPLPFPWQCQLNPLLQHFTFGRPPLAWDISDEPNRCYLGRTTGAVIPASDADKAQPATYPFVTHMYINALGDDPYPEYFWPFYVVNEYGITVGDVLHKIYENFQQHTSVQEYESWGNLLNRKQTSDVAFHMRHGHARKQQARRIDILGTQSQFRGLEPHPNREGWTMFVGLG
ncbi:hypothetical protein DXG01_008193 [Tephrocybe rancida]|nr:hypothetical protein DXG01_008193 [Tephrocybe rancida]